MGYDYHYTGSPAAGAVAPLDGGLSVRRSVTNYLNLGVGPQKLVLGVPYYGYDWPVKDNNSGSATTGKGKPVIYKDAKTAAAQNGRNWDATAASPWYAYSTPAGWRQAWYEDAQSLGAKCDLVKSMNLAGIAIWALSYDGSNRDLWDVLAAAFSQ
jgi:spore germination protein YaaH